MANVGFIFFLFSKKSLKFLLKSLSFHVKYKVCIERNYMLYSEC